LPSSTHAAASSGFAFTAASAAVRSDEETSVVAALPLPPDWRMSCRPTEPLEPTPNRTKELAKTIASSRKTHLPLPFRRSVKSFFSCGGEPFPRLWRLPLFFAPTEYPWVPLVRFSSAMASRPLNETT
jgi:hypothetical protein